MDLKIERIDTTWAVYDADFPKDNPELAALDPHAGSLIYGLPTEEDARRFVEAYARGDREAISRFFEG